MCRCRRVDPRFGMRRVDVEGNGNDGAAERFDFSVQCLPPGQGRSAASPTGPGNHDDASATKRCEVESPSHRVDERCWKTRNCARQRAARRGGRSESPDTMFGIVDHRHSQTLGRNFDVDVAVGERAGGRYANFPAAHALGFGVPPGCRGELGCRNAKFREDHGATLCDVPRHRGRRGKNGPMSAVIEIAHEATDELVAAMAALIPQLSKSNPPPTKAELGELVSSEASTMFIARVDGRIVGSLTLAMFRIPTGVRAWIEDVVVDDSARGHGVGEALNRAALDHAKVHGAITVDLTSRPSREAANRLYQRIGFVARETNIYRYTL